MSGIYDLEPVRHAEFAQADLKLPEANHLTICDAFAAPEHPLCKASIALISNLQ